MKRFVGLLIVICALFSGILGVKAYEVTFDDHDLLLCEYGGKGKDKVVIYYSLTQQYEQATNPGAGDALGSTYYDGSGEWLVAVSPKGDSKYYTFEDNDSKGSFNHVFSESKRISYNKYNNRLTEQLYFSCPKNAAADTNWGFLGLNNWELCLSDNSNRCEEPGKFESGNLPLVINHTIFKEIDDVIEQALNNNAIDLTSRDLVVFL